MLHLTRRHQAKQQSNGKTMAGDDGKWCLFSKAMTTTTWWQERIFFFYLFNSGLTKNRTKNRAKSHWKKTSYLSSIFSSKQWWSIRSFLLSSAFLKLSCRRSRRLQEASNWITRTTLMVRRHYSFSLFDIGVLYPLLLWPNMFPWRFINSCWTSLGIGLHLWRSYPFGTWSSFSSTTRKGRCRRRLSVVPNWKSFWMCCQSWSSWYCWGHYWPSSITNVLVRTKLPSLLFTIHRSVCETLFNWMGEW